MLFHSGIGARAVFGLAFFFRGGEFLGRFINSLSSEGFIGFVYDHKASKNLAVLRTPTENPNNEFLGTRILLRVDALDNPTSHP